jgi:class 3 adenylate cyclase/CheY-like chemotaxis protein
MSGAVILCVDDERIVLHGLREQLGRAFGNEYTIEIAQSGDEAIELVNELVSSGTPIPVVIADQLMPGMKGHELLINVHKASAKTFNILLTGQVELNAIGEAVNHANLYRFISKPWDGTDLVLTVKEAIRSFFMDKKVEEQNEMLKKYNEELEQMVEDRTSQLAKEKEKSEQLLLSIFPEETAEELKNKGFSSPRLYESVSVLFTDFKGFSKIAMTLSPEKLVKELDECFSAFDEIIEKHNLERIKTIGDSYMCAGGIPTPNTTNAIDSVDVAKEMYAWLDNWNKNSGNTHAWEMRIGIHTGRLVAGVIGKKKFAYDLWGDAVNVASRLVSNCEEGKINISADTYNLVKEKYPCIYRGEIAAKNRGNIAMYFVE